MFVIIQNYKVAQTRGAGRGAARGIKKVQSSLYLVLCLPVRKKTNHKEEVIDGAQAFNKQIFQDRARWFIYMFDICLHIGRDLWVRAPLIASFGVVISRFVAPLRRRRRQPRVS